MTLVASQVNGQWVLSGMTRDPTLLAPLGRYYFQAGSHWIGFDDSFAEPVIVRAFFDPSADPAAQDRWQQGLLTYLGYVQFMRLSFRGTPIPPDVYGGRLADRAPYVYGRQHTFVDFMGPSDANVRNIGTPFYPFNAMLVDGTIQQGADLLVYPRENGCLYAPGGSLGDRQALAGSLAGEISPGLVTRADVAAVITDDNLLVAIPATSIELAQSEPYRIALDSLTTQRLPGAEAGEPPWLQGLDDSGIAAQVIGDYVLLTLPDPENLGDTLVVSTRPRQDGGADVLVHVLSEYDMDGLVSNVGRDALWRINDYLADQGLTDVDQMNVEQPPGRGNSRLIPTPFDFSPDEFVLELRYWTLAVSYSVRGPRNLAIPRFLSGITWSALFQFDDDTGLMEFAAIRAPQPVESFPLIEGLRAYRTARDAANGTIDTSNFTKAAMRRDNFAASSKLRFVSASGADLT